VGDVGGHVGRGNAGQPAPAEVGQQVLLDAPLDDDEAPLAVGLEVVDDGLGRVVERQLLRSWDDRQVVLAGADAPLQQALGVRLHRRTVERLFARVGARR
jgi:hypothetical protein